VSPEGDNFKQGRVGKGSSDCSFFLSFIQDLSNISLARLILLDSMLIFFTALTFCCHVTFISLKERWATLPYLYQLFHQ